MLYFSTAVKGRKSISEAGETWRIFLCVLAGSFARQAWPVIATVLTTGQLVWGNPVIWVVRLVAAIIIGIPAMWLSWDTIKNADWKVRWAAAFTAGLLTDVVIGPPIAAPSNLFLSRL